MNHHDNDDIKITKWILFSILIVLILWLIGWAFVYYTFPTWNESAEFGDSFGAVNALFTGLAFAGVITTVLLQRRELELQRKELKLTTAELAGQKEQFIKQNKTLELQKFENTFFQLISLHNDIVNAVIIDDIPSQKKTGRKSFDLIVEQLNHRINLTLKDKTHYHIDNLTIVYQKIFDQYENILGHYFSNIYNIIKFVDRAQLLCMTEKKFYTNLLRAQLSMNELILLFFNCLHTNGFEKFKPLIEKYALLKNLNYSLLNNFKDVKFYEISAYGSQKKIITIFQEN
ncbi:MAG: putative phage abortive infection protein [Ignavibacteriae bacterium]|nr:putative phage abortive infection protein [Ignavibacteriota bacterium]